MHKNIGLYILGIGNGHITQAQVMYSILKKLGYQVINYIIKDDPIEIHPTEYPNGPTLSVSFFPTGVKGGDFAGTDYIKDYKGNPAYKIWQKYIVQNVELTQDILILLL